MLSKGISLILQPNLSQGNLSPLYVEYNTSIHTLLFPLADVLEVYFSSLPSIPPATFYNLKYSHSVNCVAFFPSVILVIYISCAWSADLTSVYIKFGL